MVEADLVKPDHVDMFWDLNDSFGGGLVTFGDGDFWGGRATWGHGESLGTQAQEKKGPSLK